MDWQLKETVNAWLVTQFRTFYSKGMKNTGQRGTKCIKRKGTTLKYDVLVRSLHFL